MARRKAVKPGVAGVICPHCGVPLRVRTSVRIDAGAVARARKRDLAKKRLEAKARALVEANARSDHPFRPGSTGPR